MSVTQVMNVARREFISRVRNKWFIIGTLMVPAILALSMSLPALLGRADIDELRLVVVDAETGRGEEIAARLAEVEAFQLTVVETATVRASDVETAREGLRPQILDDEIDGYILLEPDEELGIRGRYFARETGNILITRVLERAIRGVALEDYLAGTGLQTELINALVSWDLEAVTISEEGEEEGGFERAYFSTFVLGMLLYMTILIGGQQMGQSIIEEKSTRLIELILGAVTSTEFIAGKVLGVLGAGLLQLGVWIGLAFVVALYVLPALAIGAAAQGQDLLQYLDPTMLFYFAIFYLLGYLFYSVIYAAAASTCTSTEEFQQIAFPVMMPVMLSFFFVFYAITNPASTVTRIVSLLPPATPLVMMARVNVLRPPAWEIWLGILLLAAASAVVVWLAAKIFRFTLLMQGKRPSVGTVVRLMRAA